MRHVTMGLALAALFVGGCTQPSLIRSAEDSPLTVVENRLSARSSAPYTRSGANGPGALLASAQASGASGLRDAYGTFTMTTERAQGAVALTARMIDPARIRGIAQRYQNDCAQAAIAMVLDYYGVGSSGTESYEAVASRMAPMVWGTRIEDVSAFFATQPALVAAPVRQASLSYLSGLIALGKPVPVVVSVSSATTTMHYVVVIGTGESRSGDRYVLYKDPAQPDPDKVVILDEASFLAAWENTPIRGSWWSGLASFIAHTQPANYERVAFDIGMNPN